MTATPVVTVGVVYVGSHGGYLYAFVTERGKELWRFKTGDSVNFPPAVAQGVVYVSSLDGYLYALRAPHPPPSQAAKQPPAQ